MISFAENCGVFGIYSDKNCIHDLYYGIFKLQHRGQRYCGIATARKELKLITHKGFVRHTFTPVILTKKGIYAARDPLGFKPLILGKRGNTVAVASMDSVIDGVSVVRVRNNLGATLAKSDNVEADLVAAVPFSGIGYALGYYKASGVEETKRVNYRQG